MMMGFVAKTPTRLVFPLLVFPAWWALLECRIPGKKEFSVRPVGRALIRWIGFLLILLSLVFLAPVLRQYMDWDHGRRMQEAGFQNALTRIAPREDQLYIAWAGGFPMVSAPFFGESGFPGKMRIFLLDGFQRAPVCSELLKRFSVPRPFRDLVGRSDVFLILRPQDWPLYAAHLWEHYEIKVRAVPVFVEDPLLVIRVEEVKSP